MTGAISTPLVTTISLSWLILVFDKSMYNPHVLANTVTRCSLLDGSDLILLIQGGKGKGWVKEREKEGREEWVGDISFNFFLIFVNALGNPKKYLFN